MENEKNISSNIIIDWLSVVHRNTPDGGGKSLDAMVHYTEACAKLATMKSTGTKAHNGYNHARKYEDGTIVQWHPDRPEMGTQYLYSGETLHGYDGFKLLNDHVRGGGRVRRLDITIDTNSPINIHTLKEQADKGKWDTRCRTAPRYIKEKTDTLYVGAKTSEEMVRIYDKRGERGLDDTTPVWNRIEMKLTKDKAESASRYVVAQGKQVIPSIIKGYVDFTSHSAWQLAFDRVDGVVLSGGDKKISDTKEWLLTQVASALSSVIERDNEFLGEFLGEIYFRDALGIKALWRDEG